jgi:hypothetical protein
MSLWSKPVDAIIFDDINIFCEQQQSEGSRLDYKLDIPNDFEKVVAAFANTLGGLIVLGVEADKTTNKPVWPPTRGMPKKKPQTTTSPLVVQRPKCWPAGSMPRDARYTASRARDVGKGERGVVRTFPLSPWR